MKKMIGFFGFFLILQLSCNNPVSENKTAPAETVKIENQGVAIDYDDTGKSDTTLVFVHGWGINKTYWGNQVDYFSKKYRVITLDLPGFGNSGKNRKTWTVQDFGKDVSAVITQLDLKNVILIGHSMSGAVVVETALHNPDRVIGLIGIDNFKNIAEEETPQSKKETADFYKAARKNFRQTVLPAVSQGLFSPATDSITRKRVLADIASSDTAIALNCLEQGDSYPLTPKLIESQRKIYLINSDYTPTDTTAFKAKKIDYDLLSIHATGHYPMIEKPNEFNLLLEQAIHKIEAGGRATR